MKVNLKNVKKFERQYRDQSPIWWYTYPCFLYPMLNRALRSDGRRDDCQHGLLYRVIYIDTSNSYTKEQFRGHRFNRSFIVYRGQGLSKTDFEQVVENQGWTAVIQQLSLHQ